MKKIVAFLLILIFITPVWAEDTIDIVTTQVYTGTIYSNTMIGSGWTNWTPYLNGELLSEATFYEITGDVAAAQKTKAKRMWFFSFLGIGLTSLAVAPIYGNFPPPGDPDVIGAGVLLLSGVIFTFGSLGFVGRTRPLPYALRLAEDFNATH
jgi:hypothetical protein